MMELDKIEVDRLRRKAYRAGLRIEKSRQRHTHSNNRGGLMLIEIWNNTVYEGVNFELDGRAAKYWIDRCKREHAA
jgi:hypothetical protein